MVIILLPRNLTQCMCDIYRAPFVLQLWTSFSSGVCVGVAFTVFVCICCSVARPWSFVVNMWFQNLKFNVSIFYIPPYIKHFVQHENRSYSYRILSNTYLYTFDNSDKTITPSWFIDIFATYCYVKTANKVCYSDRWVRAIMVASRVCESGWCICMWFQLGHV